MSNRKADQRAADTALRHQLREEWRAWLAGRSDFRFGVTLVYDGWSPSLEKARADLRRWDAAVNRKMLGPRWQRQPDERMLAIWFSEGRSAGNLHWHGFVNLNRSLEQFQPVADAEWRQIAKTGSALVQLNSDHLAASRYLTKSIDAVNMEDLIEIFG